MKATYFPCVKGTMGDWVYYVTVMGVDDLVKYVKFAEEVCPNPDLDQMIQREVSDRSKDIAEYLRTQDQRFFGSLIVAAYDGRPRFLPIDFGSDMLLSQMEKRVGVLQFDGSEQYYALDGQHRLAAFRIAIERDPARYISDQISIIVICHNKDEEGISRARRLFTTVNRYAKKTSPATHTAMSEDDGVAVLTRRLIRTHDLFRMRIKVSSIGRNGLPKLATGNAMSSKDSKYLMAIETFRKCNQFLIPEGLVVEFSHQQQLPKFESLETAFAAMNKAWDRIIQVVAPWRSLLDQEVSVASFRTESGGHVLVRPIGITAFVRAFKDVSESVSLDQMEAVVEKFSQLDSLPWKGVLWNSSTKKMIVTVEAEKLAYRLWRYLFGLGENREALSADWKAMVDPGNERDDFILPQI